MLYQRREKLAGAHDTDVILDLIQSFFLDHLVNKGNLQSGTKVSQIGGDPLIGAFRLHAKPGLMIHRHQEIHFSFFDVPQIIQLRFVPLRVEKKMAKFQQMRSDHVLKPVSVIFHFRPIP